MATKSDRISKPASKTSAGSNQLRVTGGHNQENISLLLRDVLRHIGSESRAETLFPYGITRISVSVSVPGGASLSVNIEGPQSGSGKAERVYFGDHATVGYSGVSIALTSLNLAPHAQAGADSLVAEFGSGIVFTSGRRTVADQCRAMAQNIVNTEDRNWIKKTYIAGQELQDWVDQHPNAVSVADLQAGLESVMNTWDDAKLAKLSYHLSGAAFDIRPVSGATGNAIKTAIGNLANLNKFLDGEGGVNVWHLQFNE